MPYAIRKKGSKWLVINKDTGKLKGTHDSKEKAQAQIRLLQGIEHGMKPRKDKLWKAVARKK